MRIVNICSSDSFSSLKSYMEDEGLRIDFNPRDLPRFNPDQIEKMRPDVRDSYLAAQKRAEDMKNNAADWSALKAASKKYETEQGKAADKLSVHLKEEARKTYARAVWIRVEDKWTKESQGYKFAEAKDVSLATSKFLKTDTSGIVLKNTLTLEDELVLMLQPRVLKQALDQRREEKASGLLSDSVGMSSSAGEGAIAEARDDLREKLKSGRGTI